MRVRSKKGWTGVADKASWEVGLVEQLWEERSVKSKVEV